MTTTPEPESLEPVLPPHKRLSRDLKAIAANLSASEARGLIDIYYSVQQERIRSANRVKAAGMSGESAKVMEWAFGNMEDLENGIRSALDAYSMQPGVGAWSRGITGIGPVLAAGLLAYIDIKRCPTVGHIWRFAGLDPTSKWYSSAEAAQIVKEVLQGKKMAPEDITSIADRANRKPESVMNGLRFLQRKQLAEGKELKVTADAVADALTLRPWNAGLKTLRWKLSESLVKTSNHPESSYGELYRQYKARIEAKNQAGGFAETAKAALASKKFRPDTVAVQHLKEGRLPPGHIHAMAERWIVKLFLAQWHHVAYESHFGTPPPKPYVLTLPGHAHEIKVPNWPPKLSGA